MSHRYTSSTRGRERNLWYCSRHTYVLGGMNQSKREKDSRFSGIGIQRIRWFGRNLPSSKCCFFIADREILEKFVLSLTRLTRVSEVPWHEGSCGLGAKYMVAPLFPCSTLIHQDIILFSFATMIEETINQRQSPNFPFWIIPFEDHDLFLDFGLLFTHCRVSARSIYTWLLFVLENGYALQPRLLHNAEIYRLS